MQATMNYLSTDHLIVYAFLLITLAIGLWAGRGIKDIREYAIGNRTFGTAALVLTFLATDTGIINLVDEVNKTGVIISITLMLGLSLSFIVQASFLAPMMTSFDKSITMGDVMGTLYGTNSQIITGVLGFLTAICIAGMEITVLGLLCESLLGIDYRWGVGVGGGLLAIYTALGGIKSVTVTDALQFIILLIVIPMIAVLMLKEAGGIRTVFTQIPSEKLQIVSHPEAYKYLGLFLSFPILQFNMLDPALVQRLLMAKGKKQLRNQFFIVSAFSPAVQLVIMLIGITGLVLYPTLEGTQIVPKVVSNLLPVGIKGLAIAGLFAISMSTIDSFLHAAGLAFTHDVVKPLCDKDNFTINELRWTKYITVFVSLFAIIIGFARADNLYGFLLISYEFICPLLTFPFWCGIMGLKPDQRAFYTAAGVTTIVLILAKFLAPESQSHWVPIISVMTNGIVFLGMHAVRNKGFVIVSRKQNKEHLWRPSREYIVAQLKLLFPTPQRIVKYSQTQVAKYGAPYILLGIFCILNYLVPYFMWEYDNTQTYDLMLYLRFIGAMACGLLVVKDKWPEALLPYLPTFWHLTLLYCIPFTSTVMFLLTQGSTEWLINVAITIMFLIVLVDWMSFVILTALGIGLGFLFYTQLIGPINIQLDFTTGYLLVYTLFFSPLIGLLFARRKQQRFDRIAKANEQLNIYNKEMVNQLFEAATDKNRVFKAFQQIEAENFRKLSLLTKQFEQEINTLDQSGTLASKFKALREELKPFTNALQRLDHRAADYLSLRVNNISIDKLLKTVHEELQLRGTLYKVDFYQTSQQEAVQCDVERLVALLVSSVALVRTLPNKQTPVHISIADTQLYYFLDSNKRNRIQQLPALCFTITNAELLPQPSAIYTVYMDAHTLSTPASPQELPLAKNKRTVDAHYGYSQVAIQQETVKLQYILPVSVRSVRPVEVEEKERKLVLQLMRADDTQPTVQEQEQAFLMALQDRTTADMRRIRRAVEEIKWYYGVSRSQSGEPSYLYAIQVAHLVLDYDTDELTILGALFHEASKSNRLPWKQMELHYSEEELQFLVTLRELAERRWEIYGPQRSEQENMQGLLSISDRRLLYIQLADRVQRMRLIRFYTPEKQFLLSEESLLFYVPLAKALGLSMASKELYDCSAAVLNREQGAVLEDVRV